MTDTASGRFFAWRARHPHEADDPSAIWAAAWQAGGRDALLKSAQLADLVPRLEELAGLFWGAKVQTDEDERAYAWAMSNANAEEHALRDEEREELPF